MAFGTGFGGANAYQQIGIETSVGSSDPHALILLLFEGAEAAIHLAKGKMLENDIPAKGKAVSQAIQIVTNGLRASLDVKAGGEMAERLAALYDYIAARLMWANRKNDSAALDETLHLLGEIHSAWSAIAPDKRAGTQG
jgi:flagellar secretion chaperone FliS